MSENYLFVKQSQKLHGSVQLAGAKNAVLVVIASLILTEGKSILHNVPNSADVRHMIHLMQDLGAEIFFDEQKNRLDIDCSTIKNHEVSPEIMRKMRASILVMGPLLGRFGKAKIALPGGCLIGARPIDYHLNNFIKMGVVIEENKPFLCTHLGGRDSVNISRRIVFEYPSVGATENIMMFAALYPGQTTIVNGALEPEVLDLICVLKKMGADIACQDGSIIRINGVNSLRSVEHTIVPDRLEAGSLLLAAGVTGGSISLPNARPDHMDLFLEKLKEMGHNVSIGTHPTKEYSLQGIMLQAIDKPRAVNFKTGPYPGFPTDLQAPTMAALCLADGVSSVEETVFENRLMHAKELQKMGAQITVTHNKAIIRGVDVLYGCQVIATDIRASCALVVSGLAAQGETHITGTSHWQRGYEKLEDKLRLLGADITLI